MRVAIRSLQSVFTSVLLAACSLTLRPPESTAPLVGQTPAATVTGVHPRDQVTASWDGQRLIVDVESRGGIGQAAVDLTGESFPSNITLRFHLAGLEHLEFAYADTTVTVSLLSTGGHRVLEQAVGPGMATPATLAPDSPYWMHVASSTPNLIEVSAPADFLQGDHASFSIHWIDFYR